MMSAINYFPASQNATLPRLGLLMLFCAAVLLSGCKSYGPVGTPNFDPTYSRTLESNEHLLFSAWTEFVDGTFMEGEQKAYQSYIGVLLLTSERMMFAHWDEKQQRYAPSVWVDYPSIAQVKTHNNILMQYIAIVATDGSKFTYMLGKNSVEPAFAVLVEQLRKHHEFTTPADGNIGLSGAARGIE